MQNQIPFSFDVPSVSELTDKIKKLIEHNFRDILVEGEISNLNQSRNGHYYFTVKDDGAQLPCVIWRSTANRIGSELRDGQQVVLGGDIQVYPPHGKYQMIVTLVQQAGVGRLQQKFEELKKKLEQEGLFSDAHKKPLPPYPVKIGVITSATGAAFQDIRSTFEQRWPVATLYLYHASVQGLNAAGELAEAIDYFSAGNMDTDLLIIGRGGGSLEDLWPFNEEIVARAVFNCNIPIISAVGHEVDFSISDFVADARAATPTQAVIIAAPDINELRYQIDDYAFTITRTIRQRLERLSEYVHRLAHSHALLVVLEKLKLHKNRAESLSDRAVNRIAQIFSERKSAFRLLTGNLQHHNPAFVLSQKQTAVFGLQERLINRYERVMARKHSHLQEKLTDLKAINPKAPLERGFTRILQNEKWIRSSRAFDQKKPLTIEWNDGSIEQKQPSNS